MATINVSPTGGVRIGNGTSISGKKLRSLVALADSQDYMGTVPAICNKLSYAPNTVNSAIRALRAFGYDITNSDRKVGYVVKSRPKSLPHGFEHLRETPPPAASSANGKVTQLAIPDNASGDLCIEKLSMPETPHAKPFGRGVFIALADWNKFLSEVESIYTEYSSIVDAFNMA